MNDEIERADFEKFLTSFWASNQALSPSELAWEFWKARATVSEKAKTEKANDQNAELEFLDEWIRFAFEPSGQYCCGHAQNECCGNFMPSYNDPGEVLDAMVKRHQEIITNQSLVDDVH